MRFYFIHFIYLWIYGIGINLIGLYHIAFLNDFSITLKNILNVSSSLHATSVKFFIPFISFVFFMIW